MATVSPVTSLVSAQGRDVPRIKWAGMVTGDTLNAFAVPPPGASKRATVQIDGTFGGATVKLQASLDNVTYFDVKDVTNTAISATAAGLFEFVTAALYLKPLITAGTGNSINVSIVMRD